MTEEQIIASIAELQAKIGPRFRAEIVVSSLVKASPFTCFIIGGLGTTDSIGHGATVAESITDAMTRFYAKGAAA